MNIVRYRRGRRTGYGILEDDRVYAAEGSIFSGPKKGPAVGRLDEVRLLAPVRPNAIMALGRNYAAHAKELDSDLPVEPLLFIKANTALAGPDEPIQHLAWAGRIDHESELVAVIGKKARNVPEREALDYVLGYTCGNDVTARDLQGKDGQWSRSKSFDTFACLGPCIVTGGGSENRKVECRVNGEVRQSSNTNQLIFGLPRIIEHITRFMTLSPGDVIYTGTPDGISPIYPGDVVEVEIGGVGVLRNKVIAG